MTTREPDVFCQIAFPYKKGKSVYYPATLDGASYRYNLSAALERVTDNTKRLISEHIYPLTLTEPTSESIDLDTLPDTIQDIISGFIMHAQLLTYEGDPQEAKKLNLDEYMVVFTLDDEPMGPTTLQ